MRSQFLVGVFVMMAAAIAVATASATNNRPIIGIWSQPTSGSLSKYGDQYIAGSYVSWLEAGGARVVPILYNQSESELRTIFEGINGFLYPGGGWDLDPSNLYTRNTMLMLQWALEANEAGDVFPVWGTCFGFQQLGIYISGDFQLLADTNTENISYALNMTADAQQSRLFSHVSDSVFTTLATEAVTLNNHHYSITPEAFAASSKLTAFFRIMSYNRGRDGTLFVSTMESKEYPITATQWHPEKDIFEWNADEDINHSSEAIVAMQAMADVFVDYARASSHAFASPAVADSFLIYHTPATYTYDVIADFEICYFW